MKLHYLIALLLLCFASSSVVFAQKVHKATGFTYSGDLFNDPDWGWSYKTSEQDRVLLKRVHQQMQKSTKALLDKPGDYTYSVTDMSFAFDPKKQEESKNQGSKCVTCYYSTNPNSGEHFRYAYSVRLTLSEESKTYMRKKTIDDSLNALVYSKQMNARKAAGSDKREKNIQEEMLKYQKELESMDMSKLTEAQLKEIERKGAQIGKIADANESDQKIDADSIHNMYGNSYANVCDVYIRTNEPLMTKDKNQLLALKNNPLYYFKQLEIPGCDFACIYFDKFNKSELPSSDQPVFVGYIGKVFAKQSSLPKPWVNPFCVKVSFSGNLSQIDEFRNKIDFKALKEIVQASSK